MFQNAVFVIQSVWNKCERSPAINLTNFYLHLAEEEGGDQCDGDL